MITAQSRKRQARLLLVAFSLSVWFTALGLTDLFHNHEFDTGHCCQTGLQAETENCPVALLLQGVAGASLCEFTLPPELGSQEPLTLGVSLCSTTTPVDLPLSRAPPSPPA